jgi:hypothetical protein
LTKSKSYHFLDLKIEFSEQGNDEIFLEIRHPAGAVIKEKVDDISDILFYLEYHVNSRYSAKLAKDTMEAGNNKPGKMYQ